jgi:hypothetical protein
VFDFEQSPVCIASGPRDTHVLIAIRPFRDGEVGESTVLWDDGDHQRAFAAEAVLEDTRARFRFRDDRGRVFALEPMTASIYAARVRAVTGGPELATDRAVREFFLQPRGW